MSFRKDSPKELKTASEITFPVKRSELLEKYGRSLTNNSIAILRRTQTIWWAGGTYEIPKGKYATSN